MHLVENKSKQGKKIYQSILLRESYREGGKVKKRTVANLSGCKPEEIAAIRLALQYKDDLSQLVSLKESVQLQEGLSVGAIWAIYQVARRLGIERALGRDFSGKLSMWQVLARVLDQGSRLSAVRLAQVHAGCDVLDIRRGFDENDLYENLGWLADNQQRIEKVLFSQRGQGKPEIFLYDVTSSYLEGAQNHFGAYGYNRDGKRGKPQIVIGLLCDERGEPVSVEVFSGNTKDTATFASQVAKAAQQFGCERVTFVGDRGMIKRAQIAGLPEGMHYITAITKPQIVSLMKQGIIQMGLFDEDLSEVEDARVRYVLRRNPVRVQQIKTSRMAKLGTIEGLVKNKNVYLGEHARAKVDTAMKDVDKKIVQLKVDKWLKVKSQGRILELEIDNEALGEVSRLDGCYVIKTDLPVEAADKHVIHDRYKDLTEVERAFRTCKTELLEVRPVYVRSEKSTRGHVLVVMLAYMVARALRKGWGDFDLTVEEGLQQLSTLCAMQVKVKNQGACLKIPRPRDASRRLLKALHITMPTVLPHQNVPVVTRKKLPERRKVT